MSVSFDNTVSGKLKLLFDGVVKFIFNSDGSIESLGVPFLKEFESEPLTFSAGSLISVEHDLGIKPKLYTASMVCVTAQHGYSVGQEVALTNYYSYNDGRFGTTVFVDDTHIKVKFAITGPVVLNPINAEASLITTSNWKLILRAWV